MQEAPTEPILLMHLLQTRGSDGADNLILKDFDRFAGASDYRNIQGVSCDFINPVGLI